VLIADDQDMVRTGFRFFLDAQPDITVVAEARDGEEALALARRERPDVCLLDIRMPKLDGLEATRLLAGPDVADPLRVVVVTTFDLDEYVYGALRGGAVASCSRTPGPPCSPRPSVPPPRATRWSPRRSRSVCSSTSPPHRPPTARRGRCPRPPRPGSRNR
jgi:CheY-like chemotaxis protein